jgi:hypothetical protein
LKKKKYATAALTCVVVRAMNVAVMRLRNVFVVIYLVLYLVTRAKIVKNINYREMPCY